MNSRAPEVFNGALQDDSQQWWKYAEMWLSTQRSTDEIAKINTLGLFFENAAREWFYTLPIGRNSPNQGRPITRLNEFKEAFLEQFKKDESDRFREIQGIWELRQTISQTTEEFVNMVNSRGIKAALDPAQILLAVRSGLRDDIKATIMQHPEIQSVTDIIRWGTIAERYPPATSNLTQELIETIRRIDETMHKFNLRPIIHTREEETPDNNNHTGDQQHGNEAFRESDGGCHNQTTYVDRRFTNDGGERRGGSNNEYQRDYRQDYRWNGQQRGYNSGPGRGNASRAGNYSPPGRFGESDNGGNGDSRDESCQFCGFANHNRSSCPARNAECRKCGKGGHYARMCRSTAGPQNAQH